MKGRKGSTDEGGVRSPCFLRWPAKLPAGHTVNQIAGAIDLLPTLTSLAGITRVGDKPLDGRDLSPLLLKQPTDWPDRMIFSTWAGRVSVRTQQYRLDDRGAALRHGRRSGADDANQRARIRKLAARLKAAVTAWRQEMFGGTRPADALAKTEKRSQKKAATATRSIRVRSPSATASFPSPCCPARDGEPRGGVRRSGSAPNCSYFVNWTSKDDRMVWLLDVHTTGRTKSSSTTPAPKPMPGRSSNCRFRDSRLTGRVSSRLGSAAEHESGHAAASARRIADEGVPPAEAWRDPPGEQARLRSRYVRLEIPGKSVMDVRRVTLTLLE